MTRRILAAALAMLASGAMSAAVAGAFAQPTPVARTASAALGPYGAAVLRSLNRMRAHHHLPSLSADRRMARTAGVYAQVLARHGLFTHGAWTARVARSSGHARSVGEVLGWLGPASPGAEAARVVDAWLGSAEHRRVLLNGRMRRIGVGRSVGTEFGAHAAVYTVDFASAG
jgi:uncharacterized protein YkwD